MTSVRMSGIKYPMNADARCSTYSLSIYLSPTTLLYLPTQLAWEASKYNVRTWIRRSVLVSSIILRIWWPSWSISFSLTTFSPSGKLVQIEHALAAVAGGTTSLGIKGRSISFIHHGHMTRTAMPTQQRCRTWWHSNSNTINQADNQQPTVSSLQPKRNLLPSYSILLFSKKSLQSAQTSDSYTREWAQISVSLSPKPERLLRHITRSMESIHLLRF